MAPSRVAAPEVAPAETTPPSDEARRVASADRPPGAGPFVADEDGLPGIAVLALIGSGMAWFERRYRNRYDLPPH